MALHGQQCLEVVPNTAPGTDLFLVQNWDVRAAPMPNWQQYPDVYYAGSWIHSSRPPLSIAVRTSLTRQVIASGPVLPGQPPVVLTTQTPLAIDMQKRPGVPAQGQPAAPLGFGNHWIVQANGFLYDTSYGARHANDIDRYRNAAVAGWRVGALNDQYKGGFLWLKTKQSLAWRTRKHANYSLVRQHGDSN